MDLKATNDAKLKRELKEYTVDGRSPVKPMVYQIYFAQVSYILKYFGLSYFASAQLAVLQLLQEEFPVNFPAVSICNLNPFYIPHAQDYIDMVLEENDLTFIKTLVTVPSDINLMESIKDASSFIKISIMVNESLTESDRRYLSMDIPEMLISCMYYGEPCDQNDFTWSYTYDFGNCFTFNSGFYANGTRRQISKISDSGVDNSLELELFVGDPDLDEVFSYKSGAYVVVHDSSVKPLMSSEGIEVAPGFKTNIGIKRNYINFLSHPYTKCIENLTSADNFHSELYKAMFNILNHTTYRQEYCYELCYQQNVIDTCRCAAANIPSPYKERNGIRLRPCQTSAEISCLLNIVEQYKKESKYRECDKICPHECRFVDYELTQSSSLYPTKFYSKWLLSQEKILRLFNDTKINTEKLRNSILKLNVFYEELQYQLITEVAAMAGEELFGQIGGQLGLFVGMSILSVCELLEISMEFIRIYFQNRKLTKSKQDFAKN